MKAGYTNILKRGRTLLFSFVQYLPLWILIIHLIVYVIFIGIEFYDFSEDLYYLDTILRHFFDCSFITLLALIVLSANWRTISKISFACLVALWCLNTPYLVFNWQADIYFYCFSSIIYITFVILTIRVLINR